MRLRPLLIGQAPGPNTNPELPLYPWPRTSSPGRLVKIMDIPRAQYLRTFDRTNVLHTFPGKHKRDDAFPLVKARVAARAMLPLLHGREVVLVGRNVATVFGLEDLDFHRWHQYGEMFGGRYGARFDVAVVPHTIGRNRWYNSPDNIAIARAFWADYLGALSSAAEPAMKADGAICPSTQGAT